MASSRTLAAILLSATALFSGSAVASPTRTQRSTKATVPSFDGFVRCDTVMSCGWGYYTDSWDGGVARCNPKEKDLEDGFAACWYVQCCLQPADMRCNDPVLNITCPAGEELTRDKKGMSQETDWESADADRGCCINKTMNGPLVTPKTTNFTKCSESKSLNQTGGCPFGFKPNPFDPAGSEQVCDPKAKKGSKNACTSKRCCMMPEWVHCNDERLGVKCDGDYKRDDTGRVETCRTGIDKCDKKFCCASS